MKKKNLLTSLVVLGLCFSITSVAAASPSVTDKQADVSAADNLKQVPIPLDIQSRLQNGDSHTVVITDKAELEQIAREEGSEKVPVKVEYEYMPIAVENQSRTVPLVSALDGTFLSVTTWDRGSGWYDATNHLYKEYYINGPDNFKISESTKKTSTYTGNFGISKGIIEAAVGFTIGTERTVTWESTTPILSGQSCKFQLYTTHHKVDYSVNTTTSSTPGSALDPNGTYVKKTFY
ncbi:hypothetical protein J7E73_10420 [Paenibacillus albidus]|uniref:hypothetical protein n=1 Tax=Paenibacillus albidus TaxID=2041023 RepID=UPI001BE50395|nr:hypothetical protein [Paenibacillus albidus]MBT2289540.1 hypothetical protein [Paenibacillus albidus]